MPHFTELSLWGWRQFRRIELDLTQRLVVLTGPNGCGKTTILNVLGRHFGWNINFTSTPMWSDKRARRFWSDVYESRSMEQSSDENEVAVGEVKYSNGAKCELRVKSEQQTHQYALTYSNQQGVEGIHIPSHRPVTSYAPIDNIPVNPKTSSQQFQEFQQLLLQTYGSSNTRNPGLVLKQSLIGLAVFGHGNAVMRPNLEYKELFDGFQEILGKLLPKSLKFIGLEIRAPEVVFVTETGTFPLDSMSGGISAIVGMAWQIYMFAQGKEDCTVIIDEPENHLHPSMQREFLPALLEAFPDYQFIVSTHSPFVVTSSAQAAVYALTFEHSRVVSKKLSTSELSSSPNAILRDILDVPTTLPIWVEKEVVEILRELRTADNREAAITHALERMQQLGIDLPISELTQAGRSQ